MALPIPAQAQLRLSSVEMAAAAGGTRIVLESPAPMRFSLYALRNPERLALVLEGVELNGVLAAAGSLVDPDHPHVRGIRAARAGRNAVRLEIDLKSEIEPRISVLNPSGEHAYRLLLDLHPAIALAEAPAAPTVPQRAPTVPQPAPTVPQPADNQEELWLAVRINRQDAADSALLLKRSDGRLLVRREDLTRWRLRLPAGEPFMHGGEAYYPLDALRGLSYEVDEPSQTLVAEAAPGLFEATVLKPSGAGWQEPGLPATGGFLNYELSADRAQERTNLGGLFEAGVFGRWGVVASNFLARNATLGSSTLRLDTTWTQDHPGQVASLRLGDAVSGTGTWARPVRFGGVQWATNFGTQPGFVPFPLPGLSGEAALPSTVDLYVNDALRMRRQVPSGPFSIQDLPVVTGQGEARVVVRDMLGRERVITQPFYGSTRLLQQGLHDYSYELGFVRENFGMASNDYGRALAVGTHRLGLTDRLTGEARAELMPDQQTAGLGAAWLWPQLGVLSAAAAGSRSASKTGGTLLLGVERQARRFGFGASTQLASERFAQLGLQPGELAPRQISRAFASLASTRFGSLGLGYAVQRYRDRDDVKLLSASYGIDIGSLGFLGVSAVRVLGAQSSTTVSVSLTVPLDERSSVSGTAIARAGGTQTALQLQRSLPPGDGLGYRLLASGGASDRREAALYLQNAVGTYSLQAGEAHGESALRAGASGGVAFLGGEASATRRISDSFAVVRVPDYPNVRIYADNQLVGRTGADGKMLVPRLRSYQKNAIRIEEGDLPLDAQLTSPQQEAVPYFRTGLALEFAVKRSRGAVVTLLLESGEPVPAGAVVRVAGGAEEFPVGLRGEVYLTGLETHNRIQAEWAGNRCGLELEFGAKDDPLPDLGRHVCSMVWR